MPKFLHTGHDTEGRLSEWWHEKTKGPGLGAVPVTPPHQWRVRIQGVTFCCEFLSRSQSSLSPSPLLNDQAAMSLLQRELCSELHDDNDGFSVQLLAFPSTQTHTFWPVI